MIKQEYLALRKAKVWPDRPSQQRIQNGRAVCHERRLCLFYYRYAQIIPKILSIIFTRGNGSKYASLAH